MKKQLTSEEIKRDFDEKNARDRATPNCTPDELTVNMIDAVNTMLQVLKGRDLTSKPVREALADLLENGQILHFGLEGLKNIS